MFRELSISVELESNFLNRVKVSIAHMLCEKNPNTRRRASEKMLQRTELIFSVPITWKIKMLKPLQNTRLTRMLLVRREKGLIFLGVKKIS